MTQENYDAARNLYSKCLEKVVGNRDLEIEMYLSKAYYKMEQYDQCKNILKNLMLRYPQDIRIKFDLALCLTE